MSQRTPHPLLLTRIAKQSHWLLQPKTANRAFPTFDEFVESWAGHIGGISLRTPDRKPGNPEYDRLKSIFDGWVQFHGDASYPRPIYRAIQVATPRDLQTRNIGIYWTWDEDYAYSPERKERHGQVYVLKSRADFDDVDWMGTLWANMAFEEREIRLKEGTRIEIEGIREDGLSEWQPFHEQMVTAAARPDNPQTESPAFKAWFAGSQVVDQNGKPLRVYHGTKNVDIQEFSSKIGLFYFTDAENASQYAEDVSSDALNYREGGYGTVYPVYLSMKKPFDARDLKRVPVDKLIQLLDIDKSSINPANKLFPFWKWLAMYPRVVRTALIGKGYDGVIQWETEWSGKGQRYIAYVVFSPSQIKSATGNSGTFDPENKSITAAANIPKELAPLVEEAKRFKTLKEFQKAVTQDNLIDLSNYAMHRWGRGIPLDHADREETFADTVASIEAGQGGYLEDIQLSAPDTYRAIMNGKKTITMYRAVPPTTEQLVSFFEQQKAAVLQYGNRRSYDLMEAMRLRNTSQYYDYLSEEIQKIKSGQSNFKGVDSKDIQIGDYVVLDRSYAKEHGESEIMGGQRYPTYKILSKTVPKKDVVWGRADWNEWAYAPHAFTSTVTLEDIYAAAHPEATGSKTSATNNITDTPGFKAWFSGSKVVDSKGKPLVVYHGSKVQWLTSFDVGMEGSGLVNSQRRKMGGIWFTSSKENAQFFANPAEDKASADTRHFEVYGKAGEFYGAVASADDDDSETLFTVGPYKTEEEVEKNCRLEAVEYNKHLDKDTSVLSVYLRIVNPYVLDGIIPRDQAFLEAKKRGCDGIIAHDVVDGSLPSTVYVIFNGNQAKATTARSFNNEDISIRASSSNWTDAELDMGMRIRNGEAILESDMDGVVRPEHRADFERLMKEYRKRPDPPPPPDPEVKAQKNGIEVVSGNFGDLRPGDPDDYYYHVTRRKNVPAILARGFVPASQNQTMADGFYRDYSKGKVFFCERNGVSYWLDKIQQHMDDSETRGALAVLRFRKDSVGPLEVDKLGTRDAGVPCYFSSSVVKPKAPAKTAAAIKLPTFEQVMAALDQYDEYEFQDEEDDESSKEGAKEYYKDLKATYSAWKFPLTIYRVIDVKDPSEISEEGCGVFWSYTDIHSGNFGENFSGGYVIRAQVESPWDVNWIETFKTNMANQFETEIRIEEGASLKVTGIRPYNRKKGKDTDWKPFHAKSVTAAADPTLKIPDFDTFLKRLGGIQKLERFDLDRVEEIFDYPVPDDASDSERETILLKLAYDLYKQDYLGWVKHHKERKFPLTLYRSIVVQSLLDLDTEEVGVFWAWDEEHAIAHLGRGPGFECILRGVVADPEDVNWFETLKANLIMGEDESEVQLYAGAEVILTGVKKKKPSPDDPVKGWIEPPVKHVTAAVKTSASAVYPATPEWIDKAKAFVADKWRERAKEYGHPEPADLSGACKFASMFAQALFGGKIQGNKDHQFVTLPGGSRVDLTEGSADATNYKHDPKFFGNRQHRESMANCQDRVDSWLREFRKQYPLPVAKKAISAAFKPKLPAYLFHGTSTNALQSIYKKGLTSPSYWGSERVASYYAEAAIDEDPDAGEVILRVPISRFNKDALTPDGNSIAEPLTFTLQADEETLYNRWKKSGGTWLDSFAIYESVVYGEPLKITKADIYDGMDDSSSFTPKKKASTTASGDSPTKKVLDDMRRVRDEIRGTLEGQCGEVAAAGEKRHGWGIASGFYLTDDPAHSHAGFGHGDHVWNTLQDGTIIDCTHDQFGPPDILVLPPGVPGCERYHAFCGDVNCPHCSCSVCNEGFADEAKTAANTATADITDSPAFKAWFAGSTVKDWDDTPEIVYHGTNSYFDTFNTALGGTRSGGIAGSGCKGIYFYGEEGGGAASARVWGPIVRRAYLSIKNPLISYDLIDGHVEERALKAGHDGVIRAGGDTYVVFKPEQVWLLHDSVKVSANITADTKIATLEDQLAAQPIGTIIQVTVGSGFAAKHLRLGKAVDGWHVINNYGYQGGQITGTLQPEPFNIRESEITEAGVQAEGVKPGEKIKNQIQLDCLPEGSQLRMHYVPESLELPDKTFVKKDGKWGEPGGTFFASVYYSFDGREYTWVGTGKQASLDFKSAKAVSQTDLANIKKLVNSFLETYPQAKSGLNDPERAKDSCGTVAYNLAEYLKDRGVDASLIRARIYLAPIEPDACWEYHTLDPKRMFHFAVRCGHYVIDITAAQFGKRYAGIQIIPTTEFRKIWKVVGNSFEWFGSLPKTASLLIPGPKLPVRSIGHQQAASIWVQSLRRCIADRHAQRLEYDPARTIVPYRNRTSGCE